MEPGQDGGHHEDQRKDKASPNRAHVHDQCLADGKKREPGCKTTYKDRTEPACAGAIDPDACMESGKEWQGKDGEVGKQPENGRNGGEKCKYPPERTWWRRPFDVKRLRPPP
ncbi:hypothetical protein [Roseovarius sp. MMSF_3281]|uniref:hypothetical protein n=1 Tax=Roseovarius sp. MMSF_3281 TaxID=3046694 RepID=UPI00273F7734|nr:hypothetical protein [Roseovarius sp. MMSF_3281]